jgi:hypothetical protein
MGTFNTVGELKNTPAPTKTKAETGNPDPKPKAAEIEALDALQMLLDVVGLIPGLGSPADILNGLISVGRGDFFGAALSFLGAVPVAGEAATLGKIAKNSEKYVQALETVAKKVMPNLPPSAQKKLQEAMDAARKKIDEIAGKKPKADPEPPTPKKKDGEDGAKIKAKPKPGCGKGGPYKDRHDHDNAGMNWDHVPSKAALLKAAERLNKGPLSKEQITAIVENAPTIAIPEKLHQQHSETYGGRQSQKVDGDTKRIERDSNNLSKAAKENTDKIKDNVDKYDKGCKGAYVKAAKKITDMTDDDWAKWLKKTMKDAE